MSKVKRNIISAVLATFVLVGCQPTNSFNIETNSKVEKSGYGSVKLKFDFPEKFSNNFVYFNAKNPFNIKSIDSGKINRLKVRIDSTTTSYKIERTVELVLGGLEATLQDLPLDKLYTVTVTGLNNTEPVSGAEVKGYFRLNSSSVTPVVTVNQVTTPIAKILEGLKAKLGTFDLAPNINAIPTPAPVGTVEKTDSATPSPSPSATTLPTNVANALADATKTDSQAFVLKNINLEELEDVVKRARLGYHPSFISPTPFIEYILKNGKVPVDVPEGSLIKPGKVKGKVSGLKPNETAIVYIGDPASKQTVVVSAPNLSDPGDTTELDPDKEADGVNFVVDNVTPGEWASSVFVSGYNNTAENKKVTITANGETSSDFTVKAGEWSKTPLSVSGNIGNSDQPFVAMDSSDNIHAVWRQDGFTTDANSGVIFYSRWNGTSWTTQGINISQYNDSNLTGSMNPSVSVGVDRLPHVVWSAKDEAGQRKIYYNVSNGTTWQKPAPIPSSDNGVTPSVFVDSTNGFIYAVWDSSGSIMLSQYNKKDWSTPVKVGDGMIPKVTVGTDGIVHIVWHMLNSQGLQYANWMLSKGVSKIESIPMNTQGNDIGNNIDLSMDRFNRLHLLWRNDGYVQYALRSNKSWSQPELVNQINTALMFSVGGASLSVAPSGTVNVAWVSTDVDNKSVIRFRKKLNNGWKVPTTKVIDPTKEVTIDSAATTTTETPKTSQTIKHSEGLDGYESLPLSNMTSIEGTPLIATDSTGKIHVIWSGKGASSNDSDLFHSIKRDPSKVN
ncbi:MAG: hypothetical protein U0457_17505 [Candidatus Sericytochromatia bacterium]